MISLALSVILFSAPLAWAQDAFSKPDTNTRDFDATLSVDQGTTAEVDWILTTENANTEYYTTDPDNSADLFNDKGEISVWLTSFKDQDNDNGYWKCLAPHLNTASGGTLQWNVYLSNDDIDNHNGQFVYRLKPPVADVNVRFNNSLIEAPSRGFYILKQVAAASSSAGIPGATQSPTAQSSSATSPTPSAHTGSTLQGSQSSSISTGAIAGAAVGCVAAVGALAAGVFFYLRRRCSAKKRAALANNMSGGYMNGEHGAPPVYTGGVAGMSEHGGYATASADQAYYPMKNQGTYEYTGPAEMSGVERGPVELGHDGQQRKAAAAELA
ncbi:hypothetical protein EJ05DRAFT_481397 [Pseudovirgaria hyperparasitica]|uniref:Mid2 domain-containing protein n=1 Tax=Pseudovirgaria hyperparasitica TaxID=470096 RepID=A0A6A6WI24_9PEZI|nr:uncharacterized protein EJ05DRAFT_481397 [Pseudovirgaria hyperparasitica]KAF2762463.1 hypothetical protein EJ05DRAFT_481397 [Pseudovirgaria hyperparasitica]